MFLFEDTRSATSLPARKLKQQAGLFIKAKDVWFDSRIISSILLSIQEIVIVILWRQTMEINMCCILIPSILPGKLEGLKLICPRIMDIPGYFKPCGEVNIPWGLQFRNRFPPSLLHVEKAATVLTTKILQRKSAMGNCCDGNRDPLRESWPNLQANLDEVFRPTCRWNFTAFRFTIVLMMKIVFASLCLTFEVRSLRFHDQPVQGFCCRSWILCIPNFIPCIWWRPSCHTDGGNVGNGIPRLWKRKHRSFHVCPCLCPVHSKFHFEGPSQDHI